MLTLGSETSMPAAIASTSLLVSKIRCCEVPSSVFSEYLCVWTAMEYGIKTKRPRYARMRDIEIYIR